VVHDRVSIYFITGNNFCFLSFLCDSLYTHTHTHTFYSCDNFLVVFILVLEDSYSSFHVLLILPVFILTPAKAFWRVANILFLLFYQLGMLCMFSSMASYLVGFCSVDFRVFLDHFSVFYFFKKNPIRPLMVGELIFILFLGRYYYIEIWKA
jgi:hypothetical protein